MQALKRYLKVMRKPSITRMLICLLACLFVNMKPLQTETAPEYQVKAVFLFNFTQFIEWPATSFNSADSPLVIGILGKDPFGNFINETIQGESVNGHPLTVKRFENVQEIQTCHVLFISETDKDNLKKIFGALEKKNILTVGDANNFARYGGMIRFITEDRKTRLRINLDATKQANLVISSKLL